MRLSGQVVLTLVVEAPLGVEVAVVPLITSANAWRQRDAVTGWETTLLGAGRVRRQQVYRLSPWQGGDVPLEPVPVRFRQSGQLEWDEISWKPVSVVVSSVVQDADVRGARAITGVEEVPAPEPTDDCRAAVGTGLIVFGLALVGWLGWRLRWRRATPASPNDWALTELAGLGHMPPRGIHFHSHLAEIVRRYVELRFGIPAQRQTTAEFLEAARRAPWLTPPQQMALRELLTQCDLVKFARCAPGPDECGAALSRARGFVEETR